MNETQTTTDFLLSVARGAIELRATRDGYEPGAYDAERDPEGYVTSLLNALHQWTHRNGIDWQRELAQAQGFFEQDVAEAQSGAVPPSPLEITDLRCPKCGQDTCFLIEVSECLLMFRDGTVLHGDAGEQWGDASYCRCHACDHAGTVYQFRTINQTKKEDKPNG